MDLKRKAKFAKDVGKNIRKYREQLSISQEELAYKCGLYRTYIGHLENGRYSPSGFILWEIAKVLKIKVDKLYP